MEKSLGSFLFPVLLKHLIDVGLWNKVEFHPKDMQIVGWLCKVGFIHEAQETFDKIREDSLLMDRMWRALGEQQQLLRRRWRWRGILGHFLKAWSYYVLFVCWH